MARSSLTVAVLLSSFAGSLSAGAQHLGAGTGHALREVRGRAYREVVVELEFPASSDAAVLLLESAE